MPDRLPQMKPKELIRCLQQFGFIMRRTTGSHAIMRHPETKRIAVIPLHIKDLKRSLLFGILKQADLQSEKLKKIL